MKIQYGKMVYELPRALQVVEDLRQRGGFASGGEQYPNRLSTFEAGQGLAIALGEPPSGYTDEALAHIKDLAGLLKATLVANGDNEEEEIAGLENASRLVLLSLPAPWRPSAAASPLKL